MDGIRQRPFQGRPRGAIEGPACGLLAVGPRP